MTAAGILQIIALATRALALGTAAYAVAKGMRDRLDAMIAEGRDPTDAELDAAMQQIEDLNQQIQDA